VTRDEVICGPETMTHALLVTKRMCTAPRWALPIHLKQTDVLLHGLAAGLPAHRDDDERGPLVAASLCTTCWNVKCVAGLPLLICSYCATSCHKSITRLHYRNFRMVC
jgi:hypothetical protein